MKYIMKKQMAIIILIMFTGIFWPSWVTPTAAEENTKQLSEKYAGSTEPRISRKLEELDILRKLNRQQEASEIAVDLLEEYPEEPDLLEQVAYHHVSKGKLAKAEPLVERLEYLKGETRNVLELKGNLWLSQGKWEEAGDVFKQLYELEPQNIHFLSAYTETLVQTHQWNEARHYYSLLSQREDRSEEFLLGYRYFLELTHPSISADFEYYHGPATQREYEMKQSVRWWLFPKIQIQLGFVEQIFKKGGDALERPLDKFLFTHFVEASAHFWKHLTAKVRWKSTYYDKDVDHLLGGEVHFNHKYINSRFSFDWNEVATDPVEALDKKGVIDTLRFRNQWVYGRFRPGHEVQVEWYRMDGQRNLINGANNLGHRIKNDMFMEFVLLNKPYLSLNYHYVDSHWNQKFEGADTVIGYLTDEQIHYGGVYGQWPVFDNFFVEGSVSRGSDRKRHVDYVNWFCGMTVWHKTQGKWSLSYEYNYGDSGTSGAGNSQTIRTSLHFYF